MINSCIIDLYHDDTVNNDTFYLAKSAGVLAILHKATHGLTGIDPLFQDRIAQAKSIGLYTGYYHFGTFASGIEQANRFLRVVKPDPGAVLMLDFEEYQPSQMTLVQAREFVGTIYQATESWPILYTGSSFICSLLGNNVDAVLCNCPLMVASYGGTSPKIPTATWPAWSIWQYTDRAKITGFPDPVDCSHFNGVLSDLKSFWAGKNFCG